MDALAYKNPWNEFTLNPVTWGYLSEFAGDPSTLSATDNPSIQGGAYATADDLATLVLMHLRDGRCGDQQVLSPEAIDLMTEDRIDRVYGGSNVDFFGKSWGYGMGWVTNRADGSTVNGGIWGGGTSLDRDTGFGFVLALEATFQDGRALVVESTVFADSIREAVTAARG
jgi:CubicO group peptidase (beta-lactamase class C family)